jgi:pimeloyl-ACP methyl ester carboxylesterase
MTRRILYLHGFASGPNSKKASFFREQLGAAGTSLEVPDLTEGNFEQLTITSQLKVLEQLAGGDPVSLIGSSMGGYVAALYASRHPEVLPLGSPGGGRRALVGRRLKNGSEQGGWKSTTTPTNETGR